MFQPDVRKGMPPRRLERGTFEQRFKSAFVDPVFAPLQRELQAIADAAWDAYDDSRKAPITRKAGAGFADPDYEIAIDWLTARDAIDDARRRHDDPAGASRILIVNGSSRTEHTCPGEMSKSWRLVEIARETFQGAPRIRNRRSRPEPHDVGVRQDHSSLQVLRIDGDAAVSLALQLLPEFRARAGA
jgi:hypothetical protein